MCTDVCRNGAFADPAPVCPAAQMNRDRVVIYGPRAMQSYGDYDPSMVAPEWHAWLHHMTDDLPSQWPVSVASLGASPSCLSCGLTRSRDRRHTSRCLDLFPSHAEALLPRGQAGVRPPHALPAQGAPDERGQALELEEGPGVGAARQTVNAP